MPSRVKCLSLYIQFEYIMQKKEVHNSTSSTAIPSSGKTSSRKKGVKDSRLTLAYLEDRGTSYHIPVGKKWVRSYFDQFYLTSGSMFVHTGKPERTLYAIEPMFKGHDASRFSLKCCIPSENYHLSQSYLLNPDCLMALYMEGYPEPLWVGRPSLSGSLTAVLPYERHEYGNYFLLIFNLTPSDVCAKQFTKLGTGWRFDFEFMPNGITLEHPAISNIHVSQSDKLNFSFYRYNASPYDRFTGLWYDESLNFMGSASDVKPHVAGVDLPLPAGRIWSDGKYYVILQHNLYSFQVVTLVCENGYLQVESSERLSEDSPFFRLSVDVNGNEVMMKQWQHLYGCGLIKQKLMEFTATHDMDDFQNFIFMASSDYVPHPKTLASLLYEPQLYVDFHAQKIAMERMNESSASMDKTLPSKGWAVIGVHHIDILTKPEGQPVLAELESICQRSNISLLVSGTQQEMDKLVSMSKVLRNRLSSANVWLAENPVLQDYIRMCEALLPPDKQRISITTARKLIAKVMEMMHEQRVITKQELIQFVNEFIQR